MPTSDSRPNILVITADQWRGDCLGCRRTPHPVMTPHADQLAAEGVLFTQAYSACPVCMPNRLTTLTGRSASRLGVTTNFMQGPRPPVDSARTLPARLTREAGYQTKAVGKMHFFPDRARYGFEHVTLHPNDYVNWLEDQGYGGFYRGHGLGGNEVYPAVSAVPERYTHTHWIIDEAIRFIGARDPEHPFMLWIVFEAPHSPFDPPAPYDRMYDNLTIPDPVRGAWLDGPDAPAYFAQMRLVHNLDYVTPEVIRESRRRYYGQVSHIDYQLGRLLGELRTRGLYDDTAVVFTADHGEHLGDHGVFGKTTYLNGSAQVPLIVRPPRNPSDTSRARVVDAPVMTADICPTLLALAGLDVEGEIDGRSLVPVLTGAEADGDRTIFGECGGHTFATDGRFKYCHYRTGGAEQLFDVAADPDDLTDLSGDPQHADTMAALRAELIEHLTSLGRPLVEDGAGVVAPAGDDSGALRARNPFAWRGPMRYGQGYTG